MVTAESNTVHEHVADARILRQIERNVAHYASHTDEIDARLRELDREWDAEDALESTGSIVSLVGLVMASLGARRWLALPFAVAGLGLQRALRGRSVALTAVRTLGVRTRAEIDVERYALKALRGDFDAASRERGDAPTRAHVWLKAVER